MAWQFPGIDISTGTPKEGTNDRHHSHDDDMKGVIFFREDKGDAGQDIRATRIGGEHGSMAGYNRRRP